MTKRRLAALGLAAAIGLAACGCSSRGEDASEPAESSLTSSATDGTSATSAAETGGTSGETAAAPTTGGTKADGSRSTTKPATTATKSTEKETGQLMKEYIKNPDLWKTPSLLPQGFQFELQMSSISPAHNRSLLEMSIDHYVVGDYASGLPEVRAEEWGYSALHLKTGERDGNNNPMNNTYLDNPPKTRKEAVTKLKSFLDSQYIRGRANPWYSMNGHFSWHHYGGEFGYDVLGSEIGENIHSYQLHIAMNRGAARQYGKPWSIDFSMWHGPGILDYSANPIWQSHSGLKKGHSLSLMERSFVMSYMGGANSVVAEAGAAISFYDTKMDADGHYQITPYGQLCRDFNKFTLKNDDVGVNYTPVGIVLDYYHGMYGGGSFAKAAFGKFEYTAGDHMTRKLIDAIWPGGWDVGSKGNETGAIVNGPYGDYFDGLLQNAPQALLNNYPVLVLTGDIQLSAKEVDRYKAYVKQGGTLVLNTAYKSQFPEYAGALQNNRFTKKDGQGTAILYGPDYDIGALDAILKEQLGRLIPFTVSGAVQHMVNLKNDSMIVTLINNDGVTKAYDADPVFDNGKTRNVKVTYTGGRKVQSAADLYTGKAASLSGSAVTVSLKPGGIAVLEFKLA